MPPNSVVATIFLLLLFFFACVTYLGVSYIRGCSDAVQLAPDADCDCEGSGRAGGGSTVTYPIESVLVIPAGVRTQTVVMPAV